MRSQIFLAAVPFFITAASAQPTKEQPAKEQPTKEQPPAEVPKPATTAILKTSRTISDQPLKLPQGEAEMIAAAVDLPQGAATPIHQHPWSRFVYVEKGPLTVVNHDTGQTREFQTGSVLPEVVAQWHEGRALKGPVRVIVIDLVPPGSSNMIMKPAEKM